MIFRTIDVEAALNVRMYYTWYVFTRGASLRLADARRRLRACP